MPILLIDKKKFYFILILGILVIAACWSLYVLRGDYRWENLDITHMGYYNGWDVNVEEHGYGIINYGPGLTLRSGKYTLNWEIDTDADNTVLFSTTYHVNCLPDSFVVHSGEQSGTLTFQILEETDNLEFLIDFEHGTYLKVGEITLYGPRCSDRVWLITFCVVFIILVSFLCYKGIINRRNTGCFIIMVSAVVFSSLPAWRTQIYLGHDGIIHIARLRSLVSALYQGQFPVRITSSMLNGYGDMFPVYYPVLTLYPAAVMMLLHSSTQLAFQTTIIGMTAISAFSMYICARHIFKCKEIGIFSAILYLFAPYRLTDVFIRVAYGEAFAMAVMPLFFLGFYECLTGNKKMWPLLSLASALLFNSHVLSAFLTAILGTVVILFSLPMIIRNNRLPSIVCFITTTVILCLTTIVPMVTYYKQGLDTSYLTVHLEKGMLTLGNILGLEAGDPKEWDKGSRSIGPVMLLSLLCLLYVVKKKAVSRSTGMKIAVSSVLFSILLLVMTTPLFPWKLLSRVTNGFIDVIQFPFRLLLFVCVNLALSGGYSVYHYIHYRNRERTDKSSKKLITVIYVLFLCVNVVFSLPTLSRVWETHPQYKKGNNTNEFYLPTDYILTGSSIFTTTMKSPTIKGTAYLTDYQKVGTRISGYLCTETETDITFPLFAFDGFAAYLDDVAIPVHSDPERRIVLSFMPGTQGKLLIQFEGKRIWTIADILSLIMMTYLIFLLYHNMRDRTGVK